MSTTPRRHHAPKRAAALTAATVGAALLAFPGTASAQTEIDSEAATIRAGTPRNDFDGDGVEDLLSVHDSDGTLLLHAGAGDGTFADPVSLGSGWSARDIVMAGDLTGDGDPDLLARDTRTGTLYTYPGDGTGGLEARITVGGGWNGVSVFTSAGDFNSDGRLDLYAVGKSDWKLYLYPGLGDGRFGTRLLADDDFRGWSDVDALTTLGDINATGTTEILARDGRTGEYHVFNGITSIDRDDHMTIDPALGGAAADRYSQVSGVGDVDGDGVFDLAAVDSRTGDLVIAAFDENGAALHAPETVATGWGGERLPATDTDRAHDHDANGVADIVSRASSTGEVTVDQTDGTNSWWLDIDPWGTFSGMDLLETAGDFNGDGFADLLARTSGGVLYLYPGIGDGRLDTAGRIRIGGGWNAMSAIVSGSDHDGDGKSDIVAREASTGNLWLYPGTGTGSHGARVLIGTGWNSTSLITAAGDLDHDGAPDVLARKSSDDCLYFYAGKPAGGLKNGVQIGCGWNVMNSVAAVGDLDLDGHVDWIARHTNGNLYLYKGNGSGTYSSSAVLSALWDEKDVLV
ncbi:FG-GAP repeat domain-containing protein [Glycomyces dulcitolivorans]|uniref:FG-GAP repeat domain-containing protein n=1 Tax=Glycomyces dulcitolivorans TaxID=2200759 RepID=UPI000DD46F98|nr:VCBS repeat-containing protein [Glycomyces dulcitolivorans]